MWLFVEFSVDCFNLLGDICLSWFFTFNLGEYSRVRLLGNEPVSRLLNSFLLMVSVSNESIGEIIHFIFQKKVLLVVSYY